MDLALPNTKVQIARANQMIRNALNCQVAIKSRR
jgi:hypothetical protein